MNRTLLGLALLELAPLAHAAAPQCADLLPTPSPSTTWQDAFGSVGDVSDAWLCVADPQAPLTMGLSGDHGLVAVYRLDPATGFAAGPPSILRSAQLSSSDRFGRAVAVEGDRLAVSSRSPVNEIEVFEYRGSSWDPLGTPIQSATSSTGFGTRIAMADGRILASETSATLPSGGNGLVKVFGWDGTDWSPVQTIESPGVTGFGWDVVARGEFLVVRSSTETYLYAFDDGLGAYTLSGDFTSLFSLPTGARVRAVDLQRDRMAFAVENFPSSIPDRVRVVVRDVSTGSWDEVWAFDSPYNIFLSPTVSNVRLAAGGVVFGPFEADVDGLAPMVARPGVTGVEFLHLEPDRLRVRGLLPPIAFPTEFAFPCSFVGYAHGVIHLGLDGRTYSLRVDCDELVGWVACDQPAVNSSGSIGALSARGTAALTANGLVLEASRVPAATFGMFLTGPDQALTSSPGASDGDLCLAGALRRFDRPGEVLDTGPLGRATLPVNLLDFPGAPGPVVGQHWAFQFWFREPTGTGSSSFTRSLVLEVQ